MRVRIAGLRHVSRPFLIWAFLATAWSASPAQDPMRPWLGWRTIETRNYRFHFPPELEDWTRDIASRVESIDSAIGSRVGYSPDRPTHVIVDDPYAMANGYALPFIDTPVSVWWASPPDPRNDIGDYTTWGDMLAVHELTHIAHMARPSRNAFQRQFWSSLPVNMGPIMRESPRWLYEGYATVVEGQITGSGRPNNVWRPAILRQWAIEGRLPTYGQLSAWGDFNGGEFAYLGGSAFLEWLTKQEGDSSLVLLWRRMTARRARTFDAAFTGLFGEPPAVRYGQHMAELTRDAMAAESELERAGLVQGELIQRLSWSTGDPAISPDGRRVALVIRGRRDPGRLVVWNSAPEPEDTAATTERIRALKQDPLDVPDRAFYPARKKEQKAREAQNGRPYEQPRWFSDNRRVLVTRWTIRSDGTLRPDLYVWDVEADEIHRVTDGAAVLNGDPSPDGREAIAMQCHRGRCDIARVDIARGTVGTLLEGNPRRSYYRPRWSPDGRRFAASVSDSGRWRVLVADAGGDNIRYLDPPDGANRYDASWLPHGDTLVLVSERGGIPNIELISLVDSSSRTLTRVTGAAVAPTVNPADGSIWFLAMHSGGFDVRRLTRNTIPADSAIDISAERFGFAGPRQPVPRTMATGAVSRSRPYGAGPRFGRWMPGMSASGDGVSAFATIFSGDIVGRLNATAIAEFGQAGASKGGAVRLTWRYPRPALELGGFGIIHEPSHASLHPIVTDSLDAGLFQSFVATTMERRGENLRVRGRIGAGAGALNLVVDNESHFRGLAFAESEVRLQQLLGSSGLVERVRLHVAHGHTGTAYQRVLGSAAVSTIGADAFPVDASVTLGWMHGSAPPFEQFTIGGVDSPLTDSAMFAQRYSLPELPTGVAVGRALCAWRAALPTGAWTWFYEGASTATALDQCKNWNRAVGLESRYVLPPVPAAFAPRIEMRGGLGYTLDAPFRHRMRAYVEMKIEP